MAVPPALTVLASVSLVPFEQPVPLEQVALPVRSLPIQHAGLPAPLHHGAIGQRTRRLPVQPILLPLAIVRATLYILEHTAPMLQSLPPLANVARAISPHNLAVTFEDARAPFALVCRRIPEDHAPAPVRTILLVHVATVAHESAQPPPTCARLQHVRRLELAALLLLHPLARLALAAQAPERVHHHARRALEEIRQRIQFLLSRQRGVHAGYVDEPLSYHLSRGLALPLFVSLSGDTCLRLDLHLSEITLGLGLLGLLHLLLAHLRVVDLTILPPLLLHAHGSMRAIALTGSPRLLTTPLGRRCCRRCRRRRRRRCRRRCLPLVARWLANLPEAN